MAKSPLKVSAHIPAELEPWLGVALQDAFPDGFLLEAAGPSSSWLKVTGWLKDQRRLNRLRQRVAAWGGRRFRFSVDSSGGKARAMAPLPVQKIGRFRLVPQGVDCAPGPWDIHLRQGQAFGTGLHESTRLMLRALGALGTGSLAKKRCLDIGAGSGVLALAALKMGAQQVTALEVDRPSRKDLIHNRKLNHVSSRRMRVLSAGFPTRQLDGVRVDLILANILTGVHLRLMKAMAARTKPGGRLWLSGIHTRGEAAQVRRAARRAGLRPLAGKELRQWQFVELQKPS